MPNISQHQSFPNLDRQRAIDSLIFISRSEVERITGMSRSWIYQAMDENNFPRPVPCTNASRRWILGEVQAWMQKKINERDVAIEQRSRIRSNNDS
jgi:prophage regulatory protein